MSRVLLLGCGAVGAVVVHRLRADGHHVTGTTTRDERLGEVAVACDEAIVLRGDDSAAVADAVARADVVVSTVSPPEGRSNTIEGRLAVYRDALVVTAESVVAAAGARPPSRVLSVVAISSLSVLGAAADRDEVDEDTEVPDLPDPSPRGYREMELAWLEGLPGQVTILRTGDIVSPGDPTLEQKVAMAHKYLGGSVPFDDRALAYRVTAEGIAEVVAAVLVAGPQGVVHAVPSDVPVTNAELYGRACTAAGLGPLAFRRELATPLVPVRSVRLPKLGVRLGQASS